MHGAGTAPNADVFAFAAAQIKKAIEITVKLGGKGYVFWGGREGSNQLKMQTDHRLGKMPRNTSSIDKTEKMVTMIKVKD